MIFAKHWAATLDDYAIDLAWSPDGAGLAVASAAGGITLYDAASGAVRHALAGHADGANGLGETTITLNIYVISGEDLVDVEPVEPAPTEPEPSATPTPGATDPAATPTPEPDPVPARPAPPTIRRA